MLSTAPELVSKLTESTRRSKSQCTGHRKTSAGGLDKSTNANEWDLREPKWAENRFYVNLTAREQRVHA